MTFGRFIFKNTLRNKKRTALTVLSIGFSLFLLMMLYTILDIFTNPPAAENSALRLVVQRTTAFVDGMPISYGEKIQKLPHIRLTVPVQIYGGYYKEQKNLFPSMGTDPVNLWKMFPEQHVEQAVIDAFAADRTAAVVGPKLIKQFGWKVGDRVTLISNFMGVNLEFKIVGTYKGELSLQDDVFYFRWDYFNEAMGNPNTVSFFWIQADNAENIPAIADAVDAAFKNTPAETKTSTEKSFIVSFGAMLGNIKLFMGSIAMVVVFTMILVAGSTIAITIRERYREVGILKAIGYTRRTVFFFMLGEAVLIASFGGMLGSTLAFSLRFMNVRALTGGFIPEFPIEPGTHALAFSIACAIGLLASLYPAMQASNLTITDAMRRLE